MTQETFLNSEGNPSISDSDLNINLEHLATALDFKQKAAFEIMASSFILQALKCYNISQTELTALFQVITVRENKLKHLKELTQKLKDKGGELQLLMLLSGMGGSGKSKVIKTFIRFARNVSLSCGWLYDKDTVKITAMTGSAASLLEDGRTLHMTAGLNKKAILLTLTEHN